MVSIVMRNCERKDTNKTHIVVGEGSRPGIRGERAIHSTCLLGRDIPRIGSAKCYGPTWNESNGSFWRKVYRGLCRAVNARTRRRQPAVRTATTPRSVKRGHSWQMVGQEVFINRTWFLNFYSRASRPGDQADTLRPRLTRRSRFRYGRYDLPPASLSNVVAVAGPRYRQEAVEGGRS